MDQSRVSTAESWLRSHRLPAHDVSTLPFSCCMIYFSLPSPLIESLLSLLFHLCKYYIQHLHTRPNLRLERTDWRSERIATARTSRCLPLLRDRGNLLFHALPVHKRQELLSKLKERDRRITDDIRRLIMKQGVQSTSFVVARQRRRSFGGCPKRF